MHYICLFFQSSPKGAQRSNVQATHNAMHEALKEKEHHLDQLMQERDLERSEVARTAAKLDEVISFCNLNHFTVKLVSLVMRHRGVA